MLDVIVIIYVLTTGASEVAQAIEDAVPVVSYSPEFEAQKKQASVDAADAAARAAEEAHQQWHAEQEAAAKAEEERKKAAAAASTAVPSGSVWDRLAQCESHGNWHINTGNGYYGGLQFNLQTWQAYGGTGYPHEHSRATQIAVAEKLRAARGFQPWPHCSRKLGLR